MRIPGEGISRFQTAFGEAGLGRRGPGGRFGSHQTARRKQWRHTATRYDELASNVPGFIKLASILLRLKR